MLPARIHSNIDIDLGKRQTAGLTLAARLTDDQDTDVLVIEAGQANLDDPALCMSPHLPHVWKSLLTLVYPVRPASFGSHLGNPLYAWGHKTVRVTLFPPLEEIKTRVRLD